MEKHYYYEMAKLADMLIANGYETHCNIFTMCFNNNDDDYIVQIEIDSRINVYCNSALLRVIYVSNDIVADKLFIEIINAISTYTNPQPKCKGWKIEDNVIYADKLPFLRGTRYYSIYAFLKTYDCKTIDIAPMQAIENESNFTILLNNGTTKQAIWGEYE